MTVAAQVLVCCGVIEAGEQVTATEVMAELAWPVKALVPVAARPRRHEAVTMKMANPTLRSIDPSDGPSCQGKFTVKPGFPV